MDLIKRIHGLVSADKKLSIYQEEREKRSAELLIANKERVFQNEEKGKRAAELITANQELLFQNKEKEKRAAELIIANQELAFQNKEKEKRAAELIKANIDLTIQNKNIEELSQALLIANQELVFRNKEKEIRAAELVIANAELAFQNKEKEERAKELMISNSELKKAEYQIVQLNTQLEEKIVERTVQLETANKELESFSYSVSHDLRAPLRAINGFTQVLVEDYSASLDAEGKEILDDIIRNSQRMGELIDNLLEFSRIGKQNISMATVGIKDMVDSVIADLKHAEPQRNIRVIVNKLENIKGDRNMLRQVFINLISNAFKYSGKKEEALIEIGSFQAGDYCTYYVKDNGAGFDMLYYDKLFGVFQRLHSNNEFEGTGVGLAIIHKIISKHGGSVWAEAKVNEGACFYFSLPDPLNATN
jgi:signal transduction histidine kinase